MTPDNGLLHGTEDCETTLCGAPLVTLSTTEEERRYRAGLACRTCWPQSVGGPLTRGLLARVLRAVAR